MRFLYFTLSLICGLTAMAQRPELLVLGTAHLNNPGRDMYNVVVDDVLTAKRQAEIVTLVDQLARFRPTRVALECTAERQRDFDQRYVDYRAGRYTLTRDERDQIGIRLAAQLNLSGVDCVDYQGKAPGPDEAYDFMAYAQSHEEMKQVVDEMMSLGKRLVSNETTFVQTHPLMDWYKAENQPDKLRENDQFYIRYIADLGDAKAHPGANWVGSWHARNMIIVDNLRHLAKPDDRVFALFGVGHSYLLHEFAMQSNAFNVTDAKTILSSQSRSISNHLSRRI